MNQPNDETKRMTFEWCRNSPKEMLPIIASADTKLIGLLATASVIIGVVSTLMHEVLCNWSLIPFAFSVLAYVSIFAIVLIQLRPKSAEGPDDPRETRKYWSVTPQQALDYHWTLLEKAYGQNQTVLRAKARAIQWCIGLLVVEVLALIVWLSTI